MTDTPKLVMPEIAQSQGQKEVTHNQALRLLDALVQATVIDKDLGEPPGSPADGDTYIVGATPSSDSDWNGHDDDIAYYSSSAWTFSTPEEGWIVYVQNENTFYVYAAVGSEFYWVTLDSILNSLLNFIDLSDTPASFSGQAYKLPRVNGAQTALEFIYEVDLTNLAGYDVIGYLDGQPTASQVLLRMPFTRNVQFPASMTGSQGKAGVATGDSAGAEFSLKKNGVEFGTMTFDYDETVAVFAAASATDFTAGDILTIVAPASPDSALSGVGFALKGYKIN
jgi:hypothetical protein